LSNSTPPVAALAAAAAAAKQISEAHMMEVAGLLIHECHELLQVPSLALCSRKCLMLRNGLKYRCILSTADQHKLHHQPPLAHLE
jgi:TRAP-type uncharacterized transport system fused permease subunit